MNLFSRFSVSVALLLLFARPCPAMISVANVSPARAKAMGIQLKAKPNGPNQAWIALEFKPEGRLAKFQHVSLEVRDDKKFLLGWTPLKERRSGNGTVIVQVMGNREFLSRVTLRIVSGDLGSSGHDLRISDFVDLKRLE